MRIRCTLLIAFITFLPAAGYALDCPKHFKPVANSLGALGCIQHDVVLDRKGGYVQLDWFEASQHCFKKYGGRLPSAEEFTIAALSTKMKLLHPTAPGWTTSIFFDPTETAVTARALVPPTVSELMVDLGFARVTQNQVFRCWIPLGAR